MTRRRGTSPAVPVSAPVRLNAYAVMSRAVDEGVAMGVSRWSRKGLVPDGLTEEHMESLRQCLEIAVSNAICEVMIFDGDA